MSQKPQLLKSVGFSLLLFLVYAVVFFVVNFLCVFVFSLLGHVPLIGVLLEHITLGANSAAPVVSLCASIAAVQCLAERAVKHSPTRGLACILLGVFLALLGVVFLIVNLLAHSAIWSNILQIGGGAYIAHSGSADL